MSRFLEGPASQERGGNRIFRLGGAAGVCALVMMVLGTGSASAATCYSSTINSTSYADPYGDGDAGLAPEITSGTISTDGNCNLTVSYAIADQSAMLDGDFLSWFVNTDNDTATGSSFGFTGADYVIGRLPSGFVGVGRYSAATGTFELMSEGQPSGAFGARAHLGGFDPSTGTTFRVAGGASWTSSATGNSYHDFAPNPGLAPAPFAVHFTASAPPPPAPLPSPSPQPAPQPQPAPRVQRRPASAECTVPTLKRMRLSQAKKRLRSANCSVGKVKLVRSRRFAGRVVSTRPGRGTTLRAGAKVNLVVGRPEARATSAGVEAEAVRLIAAINALSRDR